MSNKEPGNTKLLVLSLLKGEEMYGYQIIEELERRSEQVFQLKEGTLYPLLHSMEREGLVSVRDATAPSGRKRRYYRVTAKGLRTLETLRQEWTTFSRAVTALLAQA